MNCIPAPPTPWATAKRPPRCTASWSTIAAGANRPPRRWLAPESGCRYAGGDGTTAATGWHSHDPAIGDDPGSGLQHVWVTLRDRAGAAVGDAPYAATITGNLWSLAYPFYQAQISGFYTLEVWADDALGNETRLPARTLALDGAAPSMTINDAASGLPTDKESFQFLNTTILLQGQLDDRPTACSPL
ncbi:MAG: hypothetical protein R2867_26670 [Caldilineaceae bacterium]